MIQRTIDIKTTAMAAFEKESKRLLMCLEEDNLLIVLVNKQNGEWNDLENFVLTKEDWQNMSETLQHIKQQSSLINIKVPDTQLYFRTPAAILIPTALRANIKLFIQTQFGWQAPDEILTDELNNAMNVSLIIPEAQITAFRHILPQATWHSTLALLIKQAQHTDGKTLLPQLFLTLSNSLAETVFIKSDELLIARCYPYLTAENLLYHLLNSCNQLNVSPAEVFIKMQGIINEKDEVFGLLNQYFMHVELLVPSVQNTNEVFNELPTHYFTHLMTA
jgi:hypothetical protein